MFVTLQTEAGHGDVLSVVPRLEVGGVSLVLGLRDERHRLVLQVVPVQALKQGVTPEFWWMFEKKKKKKRSDHTSRFILTSVLQS